MAPGGVVFSLDPDDPPPQLVDTASCKAYAAWIAKQQAKGLMDPRTADAFNTSVKTFMAAIRTDHNLHELDQLRELVAKQREATAEMKTRAERELYTSTGASLSMGRTLAAPDGEPH